MFVTFFIFKKKRGKRRQVQINFFIYTIKFNLALKNNNTLQLESYEQQHVLLS